MRYNFYTGHPEHVYVNYIPLISRNYYICLGLCVLSCLGLCVWMHTYGCLPICIFTCMCVFPSIPNHPCMAWSIATLKKIEKKDRMKIVKPSFLSAGDHTIPCGTPATHGRCEFGRGPRRLGCLGRCLLSSGRGAIHGSQRAGVHQQSTSSVAGPERYWMAWLLDLSDRSDRLWCIVKLERNIPSVWTLDILKLVFVRLVLV